MHPVEEKKTNLEKDFSTVKSSNISTFKWGKKALPEEEK